MSATYDSNAARRAESDERLFVSARRPAADRLLHFTLFLTIFCGSVVLIEPSPYEVTFAGLLLISVGAGVTIDRKVLPLLILLFGWNLSGAVSMIPVASDDRTYSFMITSVYLAVSAILYACIFAHDTMRRLWTMKVAYIISAVTAASLGIAGFFNLFPGSDIFTRYGRAMGPFKDPNVYGPFLILPALFLLQSCLNRVRLRYVLPFGIILFGLFLSFSRAAWGHFVVSAIIMMGLMFLTASSSRERTKLVFMGIVAAFFVTALVLVLLSFDSLDAFFKERATLLQDYDSGSGGRFGNQLDSLHMLLDRPFGFGPLQFENYFPQAPHNTYLNSFISYGWTGGAFYFTLVFVTLAVGYTTVFIRTPWQAYYCAVLGAHTGLALESPVIDTDHWRHYYLLLGLVWGLAIATINHKRAQQRADRESLAAAGYAPLRPDRTMA